MNFLARKISRAKWEPTPYTGTDGIRADAITGSCLRTENDTISFWQCDQDVEDVSEVVLALASSMEKIETMHLILLDRDYLHENGFIIAITPEHANTPVENLRNRHVDLVDLTLVQIVFLAKEIANKVRQNSDFYLFTKRAVQEKLCSAVNSGRLTLDSLQNKVKLEVQNSL